MSANADHRNGSSGEITPRLLRSWPLPEPGGSKHSRGDVLVVGGSPSTPGAALLAGLAALRVGAGVLSMAVPEPVAVPLAVAIPEAGVSGFADPADSAQLLQEAADKADAVLIGPGLADPELTVALLGVLGPQLRETSVLDAFAIGVLPETDGVAGQLVLTPNGAEAARLLQVETDELSDDAIEVARRIAAKWNAVVSYSGTVADPEGAAWQLSTGHPGLGTSGSGDVLSGAVVGLLARGVPAVPATCWATYLHAAAGDRLAAKVGRLGFLARELLAEIPLVMTELRA